MGAHVDPQIHPRIAARNCQRATLVAVFVSMVTLEGYIIVPAEDLSAVTLALPEHIERTLAEPGCLSFSVTPSRENPYRFDVAERFENQAAFDHHQARVQASHWGKVSANVERHYEINTE